MAETEAATQALTEALTGVVDDPAEIIEDLNLSRYVTEDGEVDGEAVAAVRDRMASLTGGLRGNQLTLGDLQSMTPAEIVGAHGERRFAALLAGDSTARTSAPSGNVKRPDQLTRDSLKNMTPAEVTEAHRAGRFADLLAGRS